MADITKKDSSQSLEKLIEDGGNFLMTAVDRGFISPEEYGFVQEDLSLRKLQTVEDIPYDVSAPQDNYLKQIKKIDNKTKKMHSALDTIIRSEQGDFLGALERGKRTLLTKFGKTAIDDKGIISFYRDNAQAMNEMYFRIFAYSFNVLRKTDDHINAGVVNRKANYLSGENAIELISQKENEFSELYEKVKDLPRAALGMDLIKLRKLKSEVKTLKLQIAGNETSVNYMNKEENLLDSLYDRTYNSTMRLFQMYVSSCHYARSMENIYQHYLAAKYQEVGSESLKGQWEFSSRLLGRLSNKIASSENLLIEIISGDGPGSGFDDVALPGPNTLALDSPKTM